MKRGRGGRKGAREAVVLGEVAGPGARGAEGFGDSPDGLLGDVFVERAGGGARGHDALDSVVLESAEGGGVSERRVEILSGIPLAQQQDLTSLMSPDAWGPRAQETEEVGGLLAHPAEGGAELVEVDRALALRGRVQALGVEPEPSAAGRELVSCNAREVGGIDEELLLGDADR